MPSARGGIRVDYRVAQRRSPPCTELPRVLTYMGASFFCSAERRKFYQALSRKSGWLRHTARSLYVTRYAYVLKVFLVTKPTTLNQDADQRLLLGKFLTKFLNFPLTIMVAHTLLTPPCGLHSSYDADGHTADRHRRYFFQLNLRTTGRT